MAGTEQRFGTTGTLLEMQPDHGRTVIGLLGGGGHLADHAEGQTQHGRNGHAGLDEIPAIDSGEQIGLTHLFLPICM